MKYILYLKNILVVVLIVFIVSVGCQNNNSEIENLKLKAQVATLEKEKLELEVSQLKNDSQNDNQIKSKLNDQAKDNGLLTPPDLKDITKLKPNDQVKDNAPVITPAPKDDTKSYIYDFVMCMRSNGVKLAMPSLSVENPVFMFDVNEESDGFVKSTDSDIVVGRYNALGKCERFLQVYYENNLLELEKIIKYLYEDLFNSTHISNSKPTPAPNPKPTPAPAPKSIKKLSAPVSDPTKYTKKICTDYGCFNMFTLADRWVNGECYMSGGCSGGAYTGYKLPEVSDKIDFNKLSDLEKVSRWGAQGVVNVIGDRCLVNISGSNDHNLEWLLATDYYTGFFISKDHIMTDREVYKTLKDQEIDIENNKANGITDGWGGYDNYMYGSQQTITGLSPCSNPSEREIKDGTICPTCKPYPKGTQGEGVFIQLFDGTWGVGSIVHTEGDIAIIKLEKYTSNNDADSLVSSWEEWSVKEPEIIPLTIKNKTIISDQNVVTIHNADRAAYPGGWITTSSNLDNCKSNYDMTDTSEQIFYLDHWTDQSSKGAPALDEDGYVVGIIHNSHESTASICKHVKSSSTRNTLGVLSYYLIDNLNVTGVTNASKINSVIDDYSKSKPDFIKPSDPNITDNVNWPSNPDVISSRRFESIDWGDDFTESGFPKSELNSDAIDIAKQATLMFLRQVGCIACEEKAKDLDFSSGCLCTAFAVTKNLIVTNDHCVSSMSIGGHATFKTYSGQLVNAKLIGMSSIDGNRAHNDLSREVRGKYNDSGMYDSGHKGDVALFRSDQILDLTPVKLADSNELKQFDPVIAVGHPALMNKSGPFVTSAGHVVGLNTWYEGSVFFELPASKGNSGSGVFNLKGEIVGQLAGGSNYGAAENDSIAYSKYKLLGVEINSPGTIGYQQRPQKWELSKYINITKGYNSSGAPSIYIKNLIELWAPGELGY